MTQFLYWLPLNIALGMGLEVQIGYLCASLIVGLLGWNKVLGFWGFFFFSILFSPLLGLFIVLLTGSKKLASKKS